MEIPQESLFNEDEIPTEWQEEWKDMPEFTQNDLTPLRSILVHFEKIEDMALFAKVTEQTITEKTRSIWFPKAEIDRLMDKRYSDMAPVNMPVCDEESSEGSETAQREEGEGDGAFIAEEEEELQSQEVFQPFI